VSQDSEDGRRGRLGRGRPGAKGKYQRPGRRAGGARQPREMAGRIRRITAKKRHFVEESTKAGAAMIYIAGG
jgi:hypothetical protein